MDHEMRLEPIPVKVSEEPFDGMWYMVATKSQTVFVGATTKKSAALAAAKYLNIVGDFLVFVIATSLDEAFERPVLLSWKSDVVTVGSEPTERYFVVEEVDE